MGVVVATVLGVIGAQTSPAGAPSRDPDAQMGTDAGPAEMDGLLQADRYQNYSNQAVTARTTYMLGYSESDAQSALDGERQTHEWLNA
ncbi:MAG: hypothetical protein M3546_15570 [Actinomycetota bacterium]|nr:hypothetical protein [Actinomycetota bacterium]